MRLNYETNFITPVHVVVINKLDKVDTFSQLTNKLYKSQASVVVAVFVVVVVVVVVVVDDVVILDYLLC